MNSNQHFKVNNFHLRKDMTQTMGVDLASLIRDKGEQAKVLDVSLVTQKR